jgi:LPXTG-motif cell wall-anchored protein
MVKRIFIMAIMVLAVIALIAPNTYAIPTLTLEDPANGPAVIIPDGSLDDSNGLDGVVTYIGTVPQAGGGTWNINVTTGITKPAIGSPVVMQMDLNSVDATSAGGGTLNIMFSEDNFGPGAGGFEAQIGGTLGGGAGSSLTYDTYLDTANNLFGTSGATVSHLTSLSFNSSPFAGTDTASIGPVAYPFSLTQAVTIVHAGNGTTSFDASLQSVPEPSSALLLLGLLLGGIGGVGLLKKKEEI